MRNSTQPPSNRVVVLVVSTYLSIYFMYQFTRLNSFSSSHYLTFILLVPKGGCLVPKYRRFFFLGSSIFWAIFLRLFAIFFSNNKLYFSIATHSQSFTYVLPTYLLWRRGHKFNVEIQHFLLPSSLQGRSSFWPSVSVCQDKLLEVEG